MSKRGRPAIDKEKAEREARRVVLHKGMLACYEVIDMARKEIAELDALDAKDPLLASREKQKE